MKIITLICDKCGTPIENNQLIPVTLVVNGTVQVDYDICRKCMNEIKGWFGKDWIDSKEVEP
jgi:hypothetical protein